MEKYHCDWLAPQVTSHHANSRQWGGWGRLWRRGMKTTHKMSQENLGIHRGVEKTRVLCVPPTQQPKGEQRLCWGRLKPWFQAIVFLLEISVGCYPSNPHCCSFPTKKGILKVPSPLQTPLSPRGKPRPWVVFELFFSPLICSRHRLISCKTMVVFVVCWYFFSCFSHNPLQSCCNFCRSVCAADMHWHVNVPPPLFFFSLWNEKKIRLLSL